MKYKLLIPLIIFVVSILFGFGCSVIPIFNFKWHQVPLHSSIEAIGAIISITIAVILFNSEIKKPESKLFILALGFMNMGILDLIHSFCHTGNEFVFFHSIAGLFGGLCFVLICLPYSLRVKLCSIKSIIASFVIIILLLSWKLISPENTLLMISEGTFTNIAITINISASLLFLISAGNLLFDYYKTKQTDIYLLVFPTMLLGIAGIFFDQSTIWNGQWWSWHFIRLSADLMVFIYLVYKYNQMFVSLKQNYKKLSRSEAALIATNKELNFKDNLVKITNSIFLECGHGKTLEDSAQSCLNEAEKLTNSKFGFIGLINENGTFDSIAISNPGWNECQIPHTEAVKTIKNVVIRGIWGEAIIKNEPVIVNDPNSFPKRTGVPEKHPPITSFLGVPLVQDNKIIGMIALANKDGGYNSKDQEAIEYLTLIFTGILSQKQIELFHNQLEDLVEKRSGQLKTANAKLEKLNSELKRSNKNLEEFAYIAAHDLQEPLRKIITFGGRISSGYEKNLDDKGKDYMARIIAATKRMQSLIDGLLNYSRVTTRMENFTPVNLNRTVKEVLSDLELTINESNAHFEIEELPTLDSAPKHMQMLFTNLISNALKFHKKEDTPVIKIKSTKINHTSINPDSEYYEITIEDNGIGIEEKYFNRIFTIFQRLHSHNEFKGTGIGLAICQKIVELHEGKISLQSKLGEGTTFSIILPVKQYVKGE